MDEYEKLCEDWKKCAIKRNIDGWDMLTLEKGTYLYQGVSLVKDYEYKNPRSNNRLAVDPLHYVNNWFSNLPVAASYAFKTIGGGEYGKVISYVVIEDIDLLDMASLNNYERFYELGIKIPYYDPANPSAQSYNDRYDLLQTMFGYNKRRRVNRLERYSDLEQDLLFSYWFCRLNIADGWGYTYLAGLNPEVFICDLSKITLTPYEYRFVGEYDTNTILETHNGNLTGVEIAAAQDLGLYNLESVYDYRRPYEPDNSISDKFLRDDQLGLNFVDDRDIDDHDIYED